jgi:hypothetical protein
MRSSLVVAAPVLAALAIVAVHAACTASHAVSGGVSPDGAAPSSSGGVGVVPGSLDAGPVPQAVGDPCRGVPLTDPDGGTPSYSPPRACARPLSVRA